MARQESGKVKIFCLTGFKKKNKKPVSQKHVHVMEREPRTFIETKQICEPFLECVPHEDLSAVSHCFLDSIKDKNRVRPNLKKIFKIWESCSRKSKSASHLRRRDQLRVDQRRKSETDLMDNSYELGDCRNDDLKHASDQSRQSDRNEGKYHYMRPINHNERTVNINHIPDSLSLREEIQKESNLLIVNKAHVSTHPANPNPRYSHESGSSSGRKELDVTRKNEIRDIRYENRLTEVKRLSPKALMLRGILNKIRIAETENVTETTATEQQRENIVGDIDKREQELETDDDPAEFMSGVDGQGLEQFFSFSDKMLISDNRRYSCMTASKFAAKRKKAIDMSHKQGNTTVQGRTSVNLNCKISPQPNTDFKIKDPQTQLSSSISSTDESSLGIEAPFSSTPVIAGSFRRRLYNPHISGEFTDPDVTDTEDNDIGQSFNVQPTSACVDLSSSVFWRSDYVLPPNTKCKDYTPKSSKFDRKLVNDIGKTDIVANNPSQIRRHTRDFVRSSTGVPNLMDERAEHKQSSYNYTITCVVNQRLFGEDESRPVSGVLPALKLRENHAELYNDWDYMKYPIHDSDSECGYSMNSESVFLGVI
ncbi:hypothetical protein ACJMK2_020685 [Sinanodonta woodiana]|uniref:Uncharacterized protein n=1 Tax=Sinanodonta woodiana TaxID=1069815 RepID=A0ABD3U0W7_SINWO